MALVADGDQVLGNVESTPRWIAQVVRLGRGPDPAAFTLTVSAVKHMGTHFKESRVF